ncbi:signal peptide peptidase-domain-containing protein [Lipomyces japonicus]|uniref:signal peptide peptidase-domain-containing protein n=1 Tax=Lipomyces japonicus TaxID=56871 RepID=UPI0034CFD0E4
MDRLRVDLSVVFERLESYGVNPVLFTYGVLLVSATVLIYVGSHATLHKPDNALPPDPNDNEFDVNDLISSSSSSREKIAAEDAYMMPVFGGVMLVGLYLLIKKLDGKYIEFFFHNYFSIFGIGSVSQSFSSVLKYSAKKTKQRLTRWKITVVENPPIEGLESSDEKPKRGNEEEKEEEDYEDSLIEKYGFIRHPSLKQILNPKFHYSQYKIGAKISKEINERGKLEQVVQWYVSSADVIGILVGIAVVVANRYYDNWLLANVLGGSFAFGSIQFLTIDSFKTGFIMLGGLFLYDIFFVFGTDIMVTVATSMTVPIKLTAPRPPTISSPAGSSAMLGLGDIIVPAIFLSLCLRFDLWNFYQANPKLPYASARKFPKPFFNAGIVFYVASLFITILVMHTFKAAQPALLYICPAIAGATFITALARGQLALLWDYKEESEEDKKIRQKKEKKEKREKLKQGENTKEKSESEENDLADAVLLETEASPVR